jgi:carboxyl-terminal processing protease
MRRARPRLATGRGPLRPRAVATRRGPLRARAVLAGVLAGVIVLLAGIWLGGHPSALPPLLRGSVFERTRSQPVTEQALNLLTTRFFRPLDRAKLIDLGLAGMVNGLDDPYSRYLDPSAYQARERGPDEQLVGIGITVKAEPKGLQVVDVLERSPAEGAGLTTGDLIVKVGATLLADRDEAFGADLIRGPAGTPVTLTVVRDGTEHVIRATRAKTEVPVATARILDYHRVRVGYLRFTNFSEDSGEDLRAKTQTVLHDGAEALVLDLRGNGGGLIREAITVASIFIAHGTIMSAVERGEGRRVYDAHGDAIAAHIPLVVLVDHGTASSAEIVTAALQDHGRAKVVGTRTHGKGVFQLTLPLSNGGALDISIGEFFTPDGRNLGPGGGDGAGVAPNVDVPDSASKDEALSVAERTVAEEVKARQGHG